jgi:hypothetical protein
MSRVVVREIFGGPEVLEVREIAEPHPGEEPVVRHGGSLEQVTFTADRSVLAPLIGVVKEMIHVTET